MMNFQYCKFALLWLRRLQGAHRLASSRERVDARIVVCVVLALVVVVVRLDSPTHTKSTASQHQGFKDFDFDLDTLYTLLQK